MMHCASFLCYSELMTISLRNLPKEVEKAILETSHREGISLNKATLRLLEAQLRKPARNSDFEEFCGPWSTAEADVFDAALGLILDPAVASCKKRRSAFVHTDFQLLRRVTLRVRSVLPSAGCCAAGQTTKNDGLSYGRLRQLPDLGS